MEGKEDNDGRDEGDQSLSSIKDGEDDGDQSSDKDGEDDGDQSLLLLGSLLGSLLALG